MVGFRKSGYICALMLYMNVCQLYVHECKHATNLCCVELPDLPHDFIPIVLGTCEGLEATLEERYTYTAVAKSMSIGVVILILKWSTKCRHAELPAWQAGGMLPFMQSCLATTSHSDLCSKESGSTNLMRLKEVSAVVAGVYVVHQQC